MTNTPTGDNENTSVSENDTESGIAGESGTESGFVSESDNNDIGDESESNNSSDGTEEDTGNSDNDDADTTVHVCQAVTSVTVSEASCTQSGTKNHLCSCGEIVSVETIPATHQAEQIVEGVMATCTQTGLTDGKKCTACGAVTLEQTTIAVLGHDYEGVITTPSTCTDSGIMTYTCKNDPSHTYTAPIPKHPHSIENGMCTRCQGKAISNIAELKNVASDLSGRYILINDIDLEGVSWTPIGYSGSPFCGIFDGNGYTISNFKVYNSYDGDNAGLFGNSTGVILNLGVTRVTINTVSDENVGCLVGTNCGTITNCFSGGSITSENISHTNHVGGLAGQNYKGVISNCYASVTVSGKNKEQGNSIINIGGLVGRNYEGTITDCYATGNVDGTSSNSSYVGGLVGRNDFKGTIKNCYATGNISCNSYGGRETYSFAGGLVGLNDYVISYCYATGNIKVTSKNLNSNQSDSHYYVGGLTGYGGATDSYGYSGQKYEIVCCTSYKSPNNNAGLEQKDMSVLQSVEFLNSTLGWAADCWNFSEGSHPTLKEVGTG